MPELGCGGAQREQLSVGGGVGVLLAAVVVARQLLAIRRDDHAADRDVPVQWSEICLEQRFAHPGFVVRLHDGGGVEELVRGHGATTLARTRLWARGICRLQQRWKCVRTRCGLRGAEWLKMPASPRKSGCELAGGRLSDDRDTDDR